MKVTITFIDLGDDTYPVEVCGREKGKAGFRINLINRDSEIYTVDQFQGNLALSAELIGQAIHEATMEIKRLNNDRSFDKHFETDLQNNLNNRLQFSVDY